MGTSTSDGVSPTAVRTRRVWSRLQCSLAKQNWRCKRSLSSFKLLTRPLPRLQRSKRLFPSSLEDVNLTRARNTNMKLSTLDLQLTVESTCLPRLSRRWDGKRLARRSISSLLSLLVCMSALYLPRTSKSTWKDVVLPVNSEHTTVCLPCLEDKRSR